MASFSKCRLYIWEVSCKLLRVVISQWGKVHMRYETQWSNRLLCWQNLSSEVEGTRKAEPRKWDVNSNVENAACTCRSTAYYPVSCGSASDSLLLCHSIYTYHVAYCIGVHEAKRLCEIQCLIRSSRLPGSSPVRLDFGTE